MTTVDFHPFRWIHAFPLSKIFMVAVGKTGDVFASQVIPSQWNRGGSAVGMKACQKVAELNFNLSHS